MNGKSQRKINLSSWCWLTLFSVILLILVWYGPVHAASVQAVVSFTDIQDHWSRSQVMRLAALEMVKGYPDHTYKPDQLVSRLETLVLTMRSGGFAAEADRLAASRNKQSKVRSGSGSKSNKSDAVPVPTPQVPWGQPYVDLAVKKGFLPLDKPEDFESDGPATRLEVAKLLARALYLVPPALQSGAAPAQKDSVSVVPLASTKVFADEATLLAMDQAYIRAVAAANVMSGYPDGSFQPQQPLTRAEMAVILSRLVDRGWVKIPSGRRLTGWISGIKNQKGSQEMEFTSLSGVQKLKIAKTAQCYQTGEERPLEQAVNFRCEVILDGSRQVSWINLLEQKSSAANLEKVRGSIKSVALGEDNLLVLSDMNCQDLILPLAWDAVVDTKNTSQGFKSLKQGDFVDVEKAQGQVRKVTVLEVKTVSGLVERLNGGRLYFKEGPSRNKPGWFNYYDRARVVDKDGVRQGDVLLGDRVQITYLDPIPGEIDDELALEIKVTG